MSLRAALYRELQPSARVKPGLSATNIFIVILVLASFVLFAFETEPEVPANIQTWLALANFAILIIFGLEYLIRVWTAGENPRHAGFTGRIRYMFSPYALADLVAFLPELLWLLLMPEGDGAVVMFLRILRLARLVKIARFVPAFDVLGDALERAGTQLLTTLALALGLVFFSAVLLYLIEGLGQGREEFASIPRAIWWAVATLTTVGYGDVYPITILGRVAASIIAIAGIGVVALPAGIFASAFADELREREQEKKDRKNKPSD